jgi:hypothetical protein
MNCMVLSIPESCAVLYRMHGKNLIHGSISVKVFRFFTMPLTFTGKNMYELRKNRRKENGRFR